MIDVQPEAGEYKTLTEEQKEELYSVFQVLDADGNGHITSEELVIVLQKFRPNKATEDLMKEAEVCCFIP